MNTKTWSSLKCFNNGLKHYGRIALKFCKDIHSPQRMKPVDFSGDLAQRINADYDATVNVVQMLDRKLTSPIPQRIFLPENPESWDFW